MRSAPRLFEIAKERKREIPKEHRDIEDRKMTQGLAPDWSGVWLALKQVSRALVAFCLGRLLVMLPGAILALFLGHWIGD